MAETKTPGSRFENDLAHDPSQQHYEREFNEISQNFDEDADSTHEDAAIKKLRESEEGVKAASADKESLLKREKSPEAYSRTDGTGAGSRLKNFFWGTTKRKTASLIGSGVTAVGAGPFIGMFLSLMQLFSFGNFMQAVHMGGTEETNNVRMGQYYRFFRSGGDFGETRIGWYGSKLKDSFIADLRQMGLKPIFTAGTVYKGLTLDLKSSDSPFRGMSQEAALRMLADEGFDTKKAKRVNGNIQLPAESFFSQRKQIKTMGKKLDKGRVATANATRALRKYGWVTFHPITPLDKRLNETVAQAIDRWKEKRQERLTTGENASVTVNADDAKTDQVDEDGNNVDASNEDKAAGESSNGDVDKTKSKLQAIAGSKSVRAVGGVSAVVGVVCMVDAVNQQYDQIKYAKVIVPLMAMGSEVISVAEQMKNFDEDLDFQILAVLSEDLNELDDKGLVTSNWHDDRSIQYEETGQIRGPDVGENAKSIGEGPPGYISWTSRVPGINKLCGTAASIGFAVLDIGIGIISGGTITTITGVVGGAILGPKVIDALANFISGDAIDTKAKGAARGGYVNYGARLIGNASGLRFGGEEMSDSEVATLRQEQESSEFKVFKQKSLMARLFDIEDNRSLAAVAARSSTSYIPTSAEAAPSNITRLAGLILNTPNHLVPQSYAAGTYDYGFKKIGTPVADQDDDRIEDPWANAEEVAKLLNGPDSDEYIEGARECFGVEIKKIDGLWATEANNESNDQGDPVNPYSNDYRSNSTCKRDDLNWLRIQFFVKDSALLAGYACYEGIDEGCEESGANTALGTDALEGSTSLRIATFNILHVGTDPFEREWRTRLPKSIETLTSNNIAVAGLQEVRPQQHELLTSESYATDVYDIFPKTSNRPGFTPNPVIWNKSMFKLVEGKTLQIEYDNGNLIDHAVQVKLEDSSGNQFYVLNTHDPANARPPDGPGPDGDAVNEQSRYDNAQFYTRHLGELSREGKPIFLTGDFNSRYTMGGNQLPYQHVADNLTYCIISRGGVLKNVWDIFENHRFTCPRNKDPAGPIDHIYTANTEGVTKVWTAADRTNGSDHPTVMAEVTMPWTISGGGEGTDFIIGSYNQKRALSEDQHRGAINNIVSKKMQVVGTQESSEPKYSRYKRELASHNYGVFPEHMGPNQTCAGAQAIFYDKSKFTLVKGEWFEIPRYPDPPANCGNGEQTTASHDTEGGKLPRVWTHIPIVWLKDVNRNQTVIVVNTHNVANVAGANGTKPSYSRYVSANIYIQQIQRLKAQNPGTPIFLIGDFNEGTGVRDSHNVTYQGKVENLLFCMFAQNGLMYSVAGPSMKCGGYGIGGVDYIYATREVRVQWHREIASGGSNSGPPSYTDHPVKYARVLVPASETDSATGQAGWRWPLKKDINPGPCYGGTSEHAGMDMNSETSNNAVYAMNAGKVVNKGYDNDAGNFITILADAKFNNKPVYYSYEHLKSGSIKVNIGDRVASGDDVAIAGLTGNVRVSSSAAHLHIVTATTNELGSYGNLGTTFDPMKILRNVKPAPEGYRCY